MQETSSAYQIDGRSTGARPVFGSLLRGAMLKCPACGTGSMFRRYLKVADHCPQCGEALHHQRADDAPAYFVILIVGHIVVPLALAVETAFAPPYWVQLAIWLPITNGLAIGLLQPFKGGIVSSQWAHRIHGFEHPEQHTA